jgi:hypothetical protein
MTLYRWKQKRIFIDYMNALTDDMLASYHSQMMKVVVDTAIKHNSMKAVELYAKLRNLLKDTHVIETDTSGSRSDAEVQKELEDLEKLLNDDEELDELGDLDEKELAELEDEFGLTNDEKELLK